MALVKQHAGSVLNKRVISFSDDSAFLNYFKELGKESVDKKTGLKYMEYPFEHPDSRFEDCYEVLLEIRDRNSEIMRNGYITIANVHVNIPNLCSIIEKP